MHFDLVFPSGNEPALVEMAKRLGFDKLFLCYPLDDPLIAQRKGEIQALCDENLQVEFAIMIKNQTEVNKAKRLTKHIIAPSKQELFEDKRIPYLLGFGNSRKPDFIHHRRGGLTQVHVNSAKRTNKTLLVDIGSLLQSDVSNETLIGRLMQNNKLFRKYGCAVRAVSCAKSALGMRAPKDLENFLTL